jgi:hypothetical protein
MQVFGASSGNGSGRDWMSEEGRARSKRAGWWFWYPLIFGVLFLVMGIGFVVGAGITPAGSEGLGVSAVVFFITGFGSLAVAWWAWRDIHSEDEPKPVPGQTRADVEAELRTTGVAATATINGFSYVAGSTFADATLVELELDVHTVKGGHLPITTQARVPLSLTSTLAKGATVPMILSSTDPSKHVIEWTGLLPVPATPPAAAG